MVTRRVFFQCAALSLASNALPCLASARTGGPRDLYRPVLHFTPPHGFMNDPNGLVFANGEWHLFFQYNPFAPAMGHVHWGHAVSRDLMHWQVLPLALHETAAGQAFSGSAVIDRDDASGLFGGPPGGMVVIYTRASEKTQVQAIAYSADEGRKFTDYQRNPVLDVGSDQFRDPKVFWYQPTRTWTMVVVRAREHRVMFYGSRDLKSWELRGEFVNAGILGIDYECPDLVEVPIEGGGSRWVLFLSLNPGAPQGGSTVQYFVGSFDGAHFVPDDGATRFVDAGKDFYAFQTFNGVDGAPVGIAWMNNWQYANALPTGQWRGAMTLPRRIRLRRQANDWKLLQEPVGLDIMYSFSLVSEQSRAITQLPPGAALDITLSMDGTDGAVTSLRFTNGDGEYLEIGYDPSPAVCSVWIDRGGARGFQHRFFTDKMSWAPPANTIMLDMRLIFDRCSLEMFALEGTECVTLLHFFNSPPDRLEMTNSRGKLPRITVRTIT